MKLSPLWRPPSVSGTSHDPLMGAQPYAGRSGIIRQAAAKARLNPPTWRKARKNGGVSVVMYPNGR